jgi:exodeoxyribonuclease VII large subunit
MGSDLPLKDAASAASRPEPADAPEAAPKVFSISQYNQSVERKVRAFPRVWVQGIIMQLNVRGRIAYITLGEFAEGESRPRAVLEATLWTSELEVFNMRFANLPVPLALRVELKVAFLLEANFYVPSGRFQPRVVDIDEKFTLGELALTRQKILERLSREGLLRKNKEIELPALPLKVGLITAPGSAAFQDFTTVLLGSGFSFRILFAGARMQGEATEATVLHALKAVVRAGAEVVCLVRGGGAKTDLVYFDSEAICRAIANCPVPVLTGIGHEIDNSLADLVAHLNLITPTDCAKFLEARLGQAYSDLIEKASELREAWRLELQDAWHALGQTAAAVTRTWEGRRAAEEMRARAQAEALASRSRRALREARRKLALDRKGLERGPRKLVRMERLRFANRTQGLRRAWDGLRSGAQQFLAGRVQALRAGASALLAAESARAGQTRRLVGSLWRQGARAAREALALKDKLVHAADPARLLGLGFSLLRAADGRILRSAAEAAPGDLVSNQLADGILESRVTARKENG